MKNWLYDKIIVEKLNNFFGLFILIGCGAALAMVIAFMGMKVGVIILVGLIGLPIAIYAVVNTQFGYLFLMVFSTFIGYISRVLSINVPFGVGIDMLLLLMFSGILLEQIFSSKEGKSKDFSLTNPVSIMLIIWTLYLLLQLFNPAGTVAGWLFGLRNIIRVIMAFIIAQRVFKDMKSVDVFVNTFIGIGLIVALYGIYQELVGLPAYDLKWATATDERINLLFIQGKWRKWSFLSDPAIFGMFMAFGSIVGFILSLGPYGWKRKTFFAISAICMLLAMLYSGTRTAYVMLPLAVVIYVLINISKIRTLVFAIVSVMLFIVVYFGPFYSKPIVRFRSAFNPSEDASMNLRDINRQRIQPYIYSHPIGGGLTTSGSYGERFSPSHPLAGFPPDSGFMETLLELGWVGLIIQLTMYAIILSVGIDNYYACRSDKLKYYYAAFIASFFALTIALYAKKNIEQFPQNLVLYGIFVLMYKMRDFENKVVKNLT